jgi:hypothetical protein
MLYVPPEDGRKWLKRLGEYKYSHILCILCPVFFTVLIKSECAIKTYDKFPKLLMQQQKIVPPTREFKQDRHVIRIT